MLHVALIPSPSPGASEAGETVDPVRVGNVGASVSPWSSSILTLENRRVLVAAVKLGLSEQLLYP